MLSHLTTEIANSLIQKNRDCGRLVAEECQHVTELSLARRLQDIAETYMQNAEDLERMLRSHGIQPSVPKDAKCCPTSAASTFTSSSDEASSDEALRRIAGAANRLRREYEHGILATRELSEKLPRQFAKVKLACDVLNSRT